MNEYKFIKVVLIIIVILLFLNFTKEFFFKTDIVKANTQLESQKIDFGGDNNVVSITCSSDGKYVYAVDENDIFRSRNFGKPGSWEQVAK